MISRRGFLASSAGVLAIRGEPAPAPAHIAVLWLPGFPSVDLSPVGREMLERALQGFDVSWMEGGGLSGYDLLITPYGSAFPVTMWPAIFEFLKRGGNWLNLGGVPFAVPVERASGGSRPEIRQTAFHKALGITHAFEVPGGKILSWKGDAVGSGLFHAEVVYELDVRLTSARDRADEIGSAGMREATMKALLQGLNASGTPIAAPFVQIDRLEGPFAGGRWVLANLRGTLEPEAIRTLARIAREGASEFEVSPSFACYYGDERPSFTVRLKRPKGDVKGGVASIILRSGDRKDAIATATAALTVSPILAVGEGQVSHGLTPGMYVAEARCGNLRAETGFLVAANPGAAGGTPLTCNRDYFLRGGQPLVLTGTTYMAADVQRKFLLDPNPAIWDRDFARMRDAGVNIVRTGIWTGWKTIMPEIGRVNEGCLRALETFVTISARHDIAVIFNLFAFLPEMWGGSNPYLDPRAVRAQKQFVFQLADRCRGANHVHWDLINEPEFCSPEHPFQCRPNYDEYERAAWREWLNKRYPDETKLRELWGLTPLDPIDLPTLEDFSDQNIFERTHPLPVIDYHLFAQDMFGAWVREMSEAIHANGNPNQLITVGQDEGGLSVQPSPLFHDQAVDFTCVHNWWLNDDLLWDSLLTKSPARPNLVEESGIMFYETIRRAPGRTEQQARDLLERKMAFAMGGDGAGFIQWLWDINNYIPDDNEVSIGFFRADGTAKPEFEAFLAMAAFWREHGALLVKKQSEDAVMIVPQSQLFSVRDLASMATKRAVRVMHYECLTPMRVAGEYALDREFTPAPLILLPCPQVFSTTAWNVLMAAVRDGATMLVTGVIDRDEHWIPADRLSEFGLRTSIAPAAQEEALQIGDSTWQIGFHGDVFQRVEKAIVEGGGVPAVRTFPAGKGKLIWCPLPLEIGNESAPIAALYRHALDQARVQPVFSVDQADPAVLIRPIVFADRVLYTLISESGEAKQVSLRDLRTGTQIGVSLPPGRAAHVILDRTNGRIRGELLPH